MNELLLSRSNKKKLGCPKYFSPVILGYRYPRKRINNWRYKMVNDDEIRSDLARILERIVKTFDPCRNIELPRIAVFVMDSKTNAMCLPYAAYDGSTATIIVNLKIASCLDEDFLLTHEMCHHFVCKLNNSDSNGFLYVYKGHLYGSMLDEGFTNFLTEQVCGKIENIAYIFPTFIARQFANILGKNGANRLYIYSAVSIIRKDFNKKLEKYYPTRKYELDNQKGCFLELSPFEVFCGTLDYIGQFWNSEEPEIIVKRKKAIRSIIEMLNYYAMLTRSTDFRGYKAEQERFFQSSGTEI